MASPPLTTKGASEVKQIDQNIKGTVLLIGTLGVGKPSLRQACPLFAALDGTVATGGVEAGSRKTRRCPQMEGVEEVTCFRNSAAIGLGSDLGTVWGGLPRTVHSG